MDKDKFILTCNCGCNEGMSIKTLDGEIFISFFSDDFYTSQDVLKNIKLALKMFCGKRILKDIIVTEQNLLDLKDFLMKIECTDEETNNDSHISFFWDKDFGFEIYLISDIPRKRALLFKNHRAFEIVLGEKERNLLVKKINYIIKKSKNQ